MSVIASRAVAPSLLEVRVLFFGRVGDRLGRETRLTIPAAGCSVASLKELLIRQFAEAGAALGERGVRWAVDQEIVGAEAWVRPGQEVAFFSMFSGG